MCSNFYVRNAEKYAYYGNLSGQPDGDKIKLVSAKKILTECIAGHHPRRIHEPTRDQSAVLIPIFEKDDGLHVVYIRRSNRVAFHKGQVSFPGGKRDPDDADLRQTALRESWEEIELRAEDVTIIGQLDDIRTATSNFVITPFVGLIPYPYTFKESDFEHDEVFDVPLKALATEARVRKVESILDGQPAISYFYDYAGRTIWGATATITTQLLEILKSCNGTPGPRIL